MAECTFQLRLMIVGLLLMTLGILEYARATTASNVALHKPATQTDTCTDSSLAVDGNPSTCSETASAAAEWTLDLKDYHIIEEVSIHAEQYLSQWVASVVAKSEHSSENERILGCNNGGWWWGKWIEVKFTMTVTVSKVNIYEWISESNTVGVQQIQCYLNVEERWETVWSTTSRPYDNGISGLRTFSPYLTQSCFSNHLRLGVIDSTGLDYMTIDAVNVQANTIVAKSYNIKMGLTHGKNETESTMNPSSNSLATWSPADKGPYRYVSLQANHQTEPLKICEVLIKGYAQPRTPQFRVITGIAMSNTLVSTVIKVVSKFECASICLRNMEPACVTAQFDQATQSCALFNGFDHTHDPSPFNSKEG